MTRRLITTLVMALATTALMAQQAPVPRTVEAVTAETDKDINDPRALKLTLGQAVNTAMQRNLGVQIQQYESRIAGQNLRREYGSFDWFTNGTLVQSSDENPTSNAFTASASRQTAFTAGVNQLLPTGGQYGVDWSSSRSTISGGQNFVSPRYNSGLGLTFTQPLMRNFGIDITRRGITIARNNLGITEESFRTQVMDTAHSIEQAYLDLIYARRNVDVVKQSLFLARDQARITQIRIDVGASAPLDILQPNVQIATTEEQLVSAVASVRDAEDRLRALMNLAPEDWARPIVPSDEISFQPMTVNVESAVTQALASRPELTQQKLTSENLRVQALYARNQTLPAVDFDLGYNLAGLAGRRLELDNNGEPTGRVESTPFSQSVSQVFGLDFPSWNVGFTFGVPILNIGARAQARAAQLDLEQSRSILAQTEQNIAVQVRAAVRAIDTYSRSLSAASAAREAAEKNVDAERKRYENGLSTNFQVLQIQQQLSDARVRELAALVSYNKAIALYHRAVGDILDVQHIVVESPEKIEEPRIFGAGLDRYNWLNYGSRVKPEEHPE